MLYSQEAEDFKPVLSKAKEQRTTSSLRPWMRESKGVGTRGIWVINRGGDRKVVFNGLFERDLRLVVRLVGTRDLLLKDGSKQNAAKIAYRCPISLETTIEVEKEGQKKRKRLSLGFREVRLPFSEFFYIWW